MRKVALCSSSSIWLLLWFCVLELLAGHAQASDQQGAPWKSVTNFPLPYDGVGDPDHILSATARQSLADKLMSLASMLGIKASGSNSVSGEGDALVPVQMAIAVVERLAMENVRDEADIDENAEKFARQLHDKWGVGHETSKGGTGVLIFLDVYNRVVFISRGGALTRMLSNARIDRIIHDMKHFLRQAKYAEGLALAVESIAEVIEKGEPTLWENFNDLFRLENLFLFFWLFIFCNGLFQMWNHRRDQIAYAQAASQLSELDRAHAEALQGNYQATSCPICLENFASTTEGSDGNPLKLLRCGHVFDESCWAEWVSSGRGDVTKCPVCRMDIGPRPDDRGQIQGVRPEAAEAPSASPTADHGAHAEASDSQASETLQRSRGIAFGDSGFPNNAAAHAGANSFVRDGDPDRDRAMRLFLRERNFRLLRMAQMYPRFISSNEVSRWSSSTYNGSLVRDPSFADNNPARNIHHHGRGTDSRYGSARGGGFGGGGMVFGGGTSAGGRSGRF